MSVDDNVSTEISNSTSTECFQDVLKYCEDTISSKRENELRSLISKMLETQTYLLREVFDLKAKLVS